MGACPTIETERLTLRPFREDDVAAYTEMLQSAEQATHRVNRLLEHLSPRDREIVRLRAGLDGSEPKTLEEIGQQLGITKERVRQLNVRIMKQLRDIAGERSGDMP